MKKLILAITAVVVVGMGSGPTFAQEDPEPLPGVDVPASCDESGDRGEDTNGNGVADECDQYYPPTTPATSVAPPTVPVTSSLSPTVPPNSPTTTASEALTPILPQTGSSGLSPILGMGALLLIAGGLIVVAARRRSTTASPTA